ncbi:VOC family protein [Oerskovia rustica]|uniref:VOC family protein n=1 Tax=Oerskovia rustica TaxID=2762237 RepID=A0ABR8RUV3_9CELL|nr:VOC family protein [Oerskovia rustica]MBD7951202.1 VOC family protein [Oerskovia rustica]
MANETMVPLLPCASIDEIHDFAVALGFEVTYRQTRPNPYLALRRGGIDLHYFAMDGFRPEDSYGSCLVVVDDTEPLYEAWAAGLRAIYGKLPLSGFPRITRPRRRANAGGLSGFSLVDPAGNWLRVVRRPEDPEPGTADLADPGTGTPADRSRAARSGSGEDTGSPDGPPGESRLLLAVANAVVQADSRGDVGQAVKILDGALRRDADAGDLGASARDRVEAQAFRAELAVRLDDAATARRMLDEVDRCVASARGQHLTQDLTTVLAQLEDVRAWLSAQG